MKPVTDVHNARKRQPPARRWRYGGTLLLLGTLGWLPGPAAANPDNVVVCAAVTNNNDAVNNGGDFVFQLGNQSITFGTATVNVFEGQPEACSAPQPVPADSTQISITQGSTRPDNWQRDGLGFPQWNYSAAGIDTVNGSTNSAVISGSNFTNATGTLTIHYANATGRRVQMCVQVEDNGIDGKQGQTWNLETGLTTQAVDAYEGDGVKCGASWIDLPVTGISVQVAEGGYSSATGYPTFGYATTDGQSNAKVGTAPYSSYRYRATIGGTNYTGTSGDITVTLTNRYAAAPTQYSQQLCVQVEGDGNAATGPVRPVRLVSFGKGAGAYAVDLNPSKGSGPGVRGTEVCGAAKTYATSAAGTIVNDIRQYASVGASGGAWNGNAPGYPKWELVDRDTDTVLVNGQGDSFPFNSSDSYFVDHPNVKLRFILRENSALGTPGGSPVMRVCARMLDNGNDTTESTTMTTSLSVPSGSATPAVNYAYTEGAAPTCIQTLPALPNSSPASSPAMLDGAPVDGFPATPAVTRPMSFNEINSNPPWSMATGYPILTLFGDAAGTAPLNSPVVAANSTYTLPLTMPSALTQDAYLFIDNMAAADGRKYQVCINAVGTGSSLDASAVSYKVGLNGSATNALPSAVTVNGPAVCSGMLPGVPASGTGSVTFTYADQTPAASATTAAAYAAEVTAPSYTCSNGYTGVPGAPGSASSWLYASSAVSSGINFNQDPSACSGDVTVNFTVELPRMLQVCTKTLSNGDSTADDASITLSMSAATNAGTTSSTVSSVEGGPEQCAAPQLLRRSFGYEGNRNPIQASESPPSYASGITPGFPVMEWESENGLHGLVAGSGPITFAYKDGAPGAITGTTGTIKVTFLNRAGPERQVTFCSRVENNDALPADEGGTFTIDRTHNSLDPGDAQFGAASLTVNEQVGQPYTEVCGPVQTVPNLATSVRGVESVPASFSNASGYPKWEVIGASGTGDVVFSGTGTDTGMVDISTVPGNPKVVFINRAPAADIAITKTVLNAPAPVSGQAGQFDLTYRISATNSGAIAANYNLDDNFQFDSDVSVVGTPRVSYSGSDGLGTALNTAFNGGANSNIVTSEPLAAGGTDSYDITVRINVPVGGSTSNDTCTGGAGNGLFNLATLNPPSAGNGPATSSTANACANTPGLPALALTKTSPTGGFTVGAAADYTLTVANNGAADAANATVHELLPANVQYNAASGASCSVTGGSTGAGQQLTCTVPGPITIGSTASFTLNVTPLAAAAGTTAMNRASVDRAGGTAPIDPATCTATDAATGCAVTSDTVGAGATDVQVTKTSAASDYLPGKPVQWTITVLNAGPNDARGVVVADTIPAGLASATWTCAASGGATCAASGSGNINDTIDLPNGGRAVYTLSATAPADATADIVNTATATLATGQADTDPSNNTASATLSLQRFDVEVTKQKTGATTYTPGQSIEYTITLTNHGPANAVGIAMADTLPSDIANVKLAGCVPSGSSTCGTSAVSGNAVTASDVAIDNGGTVVYTVTGDVSAAATAPIVNTATITGDTVSGPGSAPNTSTVTTSMEPLGRLVIVKATQPAGASDSFAFTTSGTGLSNFSLHDGDRQDQMLRPGTYTVTETATKGWVLNSLTCVDPSGDTAADLASATAIINLASGETVTCTYSNYTVANVAGAIALTGQSGSDDAVAEPGEVLTYTVTLSNAGATDAANFKFDENVPVGATLTSITGATGCTTPAAAGGKCPLTVATVPAGGTTAVTLQYTLDKPLADSVDSIANTIGGGDLDCSATGNVCSTAILPVRARLTLNKALTGQSGSDMNAAEPGEVLTYTLTVANKDTVAYNGFAFAENVPAGATLTSVTGAAGCATPVTAGGSCTLNVATVPAGGEAVVTVQFTMENPIPAGVTQVANTVTGIDDVCARDGSQCQASIASRQLDLTLTDDIAETAQNRAVTVPVLANDNVTINGAPAAPGQIMLAIDKAPANGTAIVATVDGAPSAEGNITYTPSSNFSGADSFTYKVCDTLNPEHCATAAVTVTTQANVVTAVADQASGQQLGGAISIPVLANDTSAGAPLNPASLTVLDSVGHGALSCAGGTCAYTPNDDFFGTDTFTYRICDASVPVAVCDSATVTIEVAPGEAALRLVKEAAQRRAKIGDLVRYTVTVENVGVAPARDVTLVDSLPAGFSFVEGSLTVRDGDNEFGVGGTYPLRVTGLDVAVGAKAAVTYMLRVGAGVGRGQHVNHVIAVDTNARTISNEATASVELESDPLMDESLIIGSVFDDKNGDGIQQKGEPGIPGVRIASVEGLIVETDAEGRYHLLGVEPASASRGSNFILKLDPTTLPPGATLTTRNPLVRRITPGLPARFDFGVRVPAVTSSDASAPSDQPNAASDAGER